MHTIPASEIKRRGIAALDEALKSGPVHIIKNNRPRYVVLSEEDYQALISQPAPSARAVGELMPEMSSTVSSSSAAIDAVVGRDSLPIPAVKLGVAEGRYSIPDPDPTEEAKVSALFEASEVFPSVDGGQA